MAGKRPSHGTVPHITLFSVLLAVDNLIPRLDQSRCDSFARLCSAVPFYQEAHWVWLLLFFLMSATLESSMVGYINSLGITKW